MKYVILLLCIGGAGFYFFTANQPKPIEKLAPLPPPKPLPPPPPPPELSAEELEKARRDLFSFDTAVRRETLKTLNANFNPEINAMLIRQMRIDSDVSIRIETINLLAKRRMKDETGDQAAVRILHALNDTEPSVRLTALQAIRRMQARSAAPQVTEKLYDTDVGVRQEAISTLNYLAGIETGKIKKARVAAYRLPSEYQATYREALAHAQAAQAAPQPE